jgi:fission process protein 1
MSGTRTSSISDKATQELTLLADKNVDSTDSDIRYMAYGARLRTALRASSRYIAYVRSLLTRTRHRHTGYLDQ